MKDLKIFEETSADGINSIIYASWTHKEVLYKTDGSSIGYGFESRLIAEVIRDGIKKTVHVETPHRSEILDAIRYYRDGRYFDNLKAALYKRYKQDEDLYHFSDYCLHFCLEGKRMKYKPTPMKGLYEVFEEAAGGKETSVGHEMLTESEYLKMVKESNENGRG